MAKIDSLNELILEIGKRPELKGKFWLALSNRLRRRYGWERDVLEHVLRGHLDKRLFPLSESCKPVDTSTYKFGPRGVFVYELNKDFTISINQDIESEVKISNTLRKCFLKKELMNLDLFEQFLKKEISDFIQEFDFSVDYVHEAWLGDLRSMRMTLDQNSPFEKRDAYLSLLKEIYGEVVGVYTSFPIGIIARNERLSYRANGLLNQKYKKVNSFTTPEIIQENFDENSLLTKLNFVYTVDFKGSDDILFHINKEEIRDNDALFEHSNPKIKESTAIKIADYVRYRLRNVMGDIIMSYLDKYVPKQ